jgi:hypothetical protein
MTEYPAHTSLANTPRSQFMDELVAEFTELQAKLAEAEKLIESLKLAGGNNLALEVMKHLADSLLVHYNYMARHHNLDYQKTSMYSFAKIALNLYADTFANGKYAVRESEFNNQQGE